MATLILDPTGNGSPYNWSNSYANVDDGIRQPAASGTGDGLAIDSSSEGQEARLTYPDGAISGTITAIEGWVIADSGRPDFGVVLSGSDLGLRSSISGSASNSWYSYNYTGLSVALSGATFVTRHVCSDEEDDYLKAVYIIVTYTPAAAGSVIYPSHLFQNNVIVPTWL